MAFKTLNTNYTLNMVAGDTEFIRLTLKDSTGNVIDVSTDVTCTLGIKREQGDTTFIIPETFSTAFVYDAITQPYTIEFKLDSDATIALLNYEGKARNKLACFYDIELHNTFLGVDERTTILSGTLNIKRSISGRVE